MFRQADAQRALSPCNASGGRVAARCRPFRAPMATKIAAARSRRPRGTLASRGSTAWWRGGSSLALGFTPSAIRHRVAIGRLHPVAAGRLRGRSTAIDREGRWMAAVLACGDGRDAQPRERRGALGDRPRAAERDRGQRSRRRVSRRAATAYRSAARPALPAADVTVHRGIPVTTPGPHASSTRRRRARAGRGRAPGQRGGLARTDRPRGSARASSTSAPASPASRRLRPLLDGATFRLSDSELEQILCPLLAAAGLPPPQTRQRVNRLRVDFWWPDLGFVVEADSFRYHRTALQAAHATSNATRPTSPPAWSRCASATGRCRTNAA